MKWRRHLLDFSGAAGASFTATATDGVIYIALLWTLVDDDVISVGLAAGFGAIVGGLVHYAMNRFWVFRRFRAPVGQSALTYFPMSWLAALLHGLAVEALTGWFDPKLAWFFSKGIIWIGWTYPMSRYVVFGGIGSGDNAEASDEEGSPPGDEH